MTSTVKEMNDGPLTRALATLPDRMDSVAARVLLLTIGLQESALIYRRQLPSGPARGLLQFEEGGGVKGVMNHAATKKYARLIADNRGVAFTTRNVWSALEYDDVLAFGMGRLLMWSDPQALPALGDIQGAWALYLRTWRPGAHTRGDAATRNRLWLKFKGNYERVMAELGITA